MSHVVIVDYGSGNLRSVQKSVERVAPSGMRVEISQDPKMLRDASHIILPGVGAFGDCMRGLLAVKGLRETLEVEVRQKNKWFLGICVGMQLLFERGYEFGVHPGLGWLSGEVVKINSGNASLKIPHMGWNDLMIQLPDHPIVRGIHTGDHAYFVHSFHAQCADPQNIVSTTEYGATLTAIVAQNNMIGTQFHPEKSQRVGLDLLRNFLSL
jgi:glutamine amidotransferase